MPEETFQEIFRYGWPIVIAACLLLIFLSVSTLTIILSDVELRRTSSCIFIANLAVVDLLLASTNILKMITESCYMGMRKSWIMAELDASFMCIIASSSLLSTFVNSVDRFIFIKYSIHYHRMMSVPRTKCIVAAIWIFAFPFGCFPMVVNILNDQKGLSLPYSKARVYGSFLPLCIMFGICGTACEVMIGILFVIIRRRRRDIITSRHVLPAAVSDIYSRNSSIESSASAITISTESFDQVTRDDRYEQDNDDIEKPILDRDITDTKNASNTADFEIGLQSDEKLMCSYVTFHTSFQDSDNNNGVYNGGKNNGSKIVKIADRQLTSAETFDTLIHVNTKNTCYNDVNFNQDNDSNNSNSSNNNNSNNKMNNNTNKDIFKNNKVNAGDDGNNNNSNDNSNNNNNNNNTNNNNNYNNNNNNNNKNINNNNNNNNNNSNPKTKPTSVSKVESHSNSKPKDGPDNVTFYLAPNPKPEHTPQPAQSVFINHSPLTSTLTKAAPNPQENCKFKPKRRFSNMSVNEDFQTAKTLFILLGVYILMWTPNYTILFFSSIEVIPLQANGYLVLAYLANIFNSIFDFFVYPMRIPKIRKIFLNAIKKSCGWFRRRK